MLKKIGALSACGLLAATLAAQPANAAVVIYSGYDANASSISTKPNADAAQAAFLGAVAGRPSTFTATFEGFAAGALGVRALGGGASVTGSDAGGFAQMIRTAPLCQFSLCGGNTTVGGKTYLSAGSGMLTFTFANPIEAFGAFITGPQIEGLKFTFSDGSQQSVAVPSHFGADYVGFTDFGKSISQITFDANKDVLALDDITYTLAPVSGVPEPALWATMIAGFGLVGASLRGRRRALA